MPRIGVASVGLMDPKIEVSRDMAAPVEKVFETVTDITRMGEWSPENVLCEWLDDHTQAEVGAMWLGHNRNGDKEWKTKARVIEFVPNSRFAFECLARDFVFAKWAYDFEAIEGGCRVTESAQDLRPEEIKGRGLAISGVEDRDARNRENMTITLDRIAAAVEA